MVTEYRAALYRLTSVKPPYLIDCIDGNMDPTQLTVVQLKSELRRRELPVGGSKLELISRLDTSDSSRQWVQCILSRQIVSEDSPSRKGDDEQESYEESEGEEARASCVPREMARSPMRMLTNNNSENNGYQDPQAQRMSDLAQKEIELTRRENELLRRELELARRDIAHRRIDEVDVVRENTPETRSRESVQSLLELASHFDGSEGTFEKWERQIRLLCRTYALDDNRAKLLISNKLLGKAKVWFQSEDCVVMTLDQILEGLRRMYDHRPMRIALRRKFEARGWKQVESFADYYHDKVMLGKDSLIDEGDMVDYLIDGIPQERLRDMAILKEFVHKEDMLRVFEKISLGSDTSSASRREVQAGGKASCRSGTQRSFTTNKWAADVQKNERTNKTSEPVRKKVRCFNCSNFGHISAECKEAKREKGSCFKCGNKNHQLKDCPQAVGRKQIAVVDEPDSAEEVMVTTQVLSDVKEVVTPVVADEGDTFFRDVDYRVSRSDLDCRFTLSTRFDTASKVSFVKESLIPISAIERLGNERVSYYGLNRSPLVVKGSVKLDIDIDSDK